MLRFRSVCLAVLAVPIAWVDLSHSATVFSYDASGGQFPTSQGWSAWEVDTDGPLTAANTAGTSADNANAVIENVGGANVLHIRDTVSDSGFDLPNYYYPWTPTEQQLLIDHGLKFTMVFQAIGTQSANGNVRFGFNGTEFELQHDNIIADRTISVTNFQNHAPEDGDFHTLEITGEKTGNNYNLFFSIDGAAAAALTIGGNPAAPPLENAVYFGGNSSAGMGTDLLIKSIVMETLYPVVPEPSSLWLLAFGIGAWRLFRF